MKQLASGYYLVTAALGAIAFVTPILKAVPYDVTNKSGQYAALVALCAAALVFAESVRWEGHAIINRSRRPVVGAFLLGSAYLWLADESKSNPASWDLPTNIAIVWILASLVVAAPLAPLIFSGLASAIPRWFAAIAQRFVSKAGGHATVRQQAQTYRERSRTLLAEAREELGAGGLEQASVKGWGAAAQIVKAVADERGMPHEHHRFLSITVGTLREESNDSELRWLFDTASFLHTNFYENTLNHSEVEESLQRVGMFVEKMDRFLPPE